MLLNFDSKHAEKVTFIIENTSPGIHGVNVTDLYLKGLVLT